MARPARLSQNPGVAVEPTGRRTLRVLIVEDDAHVRRVLRRILAEVTSDVVECETGTDAARVFADARPDVVLMDIRLPGVDGLAATREIRAVTPDARVVIVTNHDEAPLRRAAREAGAAAYVLKDGLLEIRSLLASWFPAPNP